MGLLKKQAEESEAEDAPVPARGEFGSGFDLLTRKVQQSKDRFENAKKRFTPTLWMKDGESRIVRFIDLKPVLVYEHTLRGDNNRFNSFTCRVKVTEADGVGEQGVCPFCDNAFKKSLRAVFNVIDRSEWKDKQNKTHRNEVVFLKANMELATQLKGLAARGKLESHEIEISRTGEGKNTHYQALPVDEPSKMSVEDRQKKRMSISEKLAPISASEMEKMLGGGGGGGRREDQD